MNRDREVSISVTGLTTDMIDRLNYLFASFTPPERDDVDWVYATGTLTPNGEFIGVATVYTTLSFLPIVSQYVGEYNTYQWTNADTRQLLDEEYPNVAKYLQVK